MAFAYVYILTNEPQGVLYIGVTSDLPKRIYEHQNKVVPGFTKRYNLEKLVWYEPHDDINQAIKREKQLKKWPRQYKLNLVNQVNPAWQDLSGSLGFARSP